MANSANIPTQSIVQLNTHKADIANPHNVTAIQVGNSTSGIAVNKNHIIAGGMDIWLEGTSFPAIGANTYIATLFKTIVSVAGATKTVSQGTTDFNAGDYSLNYDVTTGGAVGANGVEGFSARIEGYVLAELLSRARTLDATNENITISFDVLATVTGVYSVSINRGDSLDRYIREYTIVGANTAQRISVTIPMSGRSGTWNFDNTLGAIITFGLDGNGTEKVAADTWGVSGNVSANQVNSLATTGNKFYITNLKIEAGAVATPFEGYDRASELAKVKWYFERLAFGGSRYITTGSVANNSTVTWVLQYLEKRVAPSAITIPTNIKALVAIGGFPTGTASHVSLSYSKTTCRVDFTSTAADYTVGNTSNIFTSGAANIDIDARL